MHLGFLLLLALLAHLLLMTANGLIWGEMLLQHPYSRPWTMLIPNIAVNGGLLQSYYWASFDLSREESYRHQREKLIDSLPII